jgi:FAD/FMN-containing dehydrogenase
MAAPMTDKVQAQLRDQVIRKFSANFGGEIILPSDGFYQRARLVWNRAVNKYPVMIARCTSNDDVKRGVEFARTQNLPLAVRAGATASRVMASATVVFSSILRG